MPGYITRIESFLREIARNTGGPPMSDRPGSDVPIPVEFEI